MGSRMTAGWERLGGRKIFKKGKRTHGQQCGDCWGKEDIMRLNGKGKNTIKFKLKNKIKIKRYQWEISSHDGGVVKKPFTFSHKQKEYNNQSRIHKQREVPENQTAWNSDNQGIKERVNQNNQTGSTTAQQRGLPCPGEYLRPCPLTI